MQCLWSEICENEASPPTMRGLNRYGHIVAHHTVFGASIQSLSRINSKLVTPYFNAFCACSSRWDQFVARLEEYCNGEGQGYSAWPFHEP